MNLSTSVLGLNFKNPLVTAAGKWVWTAEQCRKAVDGGAGGITTKSFSTLVRKGHADPTVIHTEHYTLNAVGLPSEGPDAVRDDLGDFLKSREVPVFISIFGDTVERFAESAAAFAAFGPDALELNISCPNVQDDHGRPFSYAPDTAAAAIRAAMDAAPGVKMFAKLSANTPDIVSVALACAEAGCSGLTLVNTLGPGMVIDLETRKPVLTNKTGGISGHAIKPVAVRCVADIYKATDGKLPIIGTGGVQSGEDAIELLLAGASLVGMGTAVLENGYGIFRKVAEEMSEWCSAHKVTDISELSGGMHR
jgi:dihydroorotate dehydrogenase (NAD+) catalytic subunit